jgi:hypothetical protein
VKTYRETVIEIFNGLAFSVRPKCLLDAVLLKCAGYFGIFNSVIFCMELPIT